MRVISRPNRNTRPELGRISPMATFSSVVFPLPAAPRTTFVCAGRTSNEIPSSALTSSKTTLTLSNRNRISVSAGSAATLLHVHKNACDQRGDEKDPHRRHYNGLRGSPADPLRSPGGAHPVK